MQHESGTRDHEYFGGRPEKLYKSEKVATLVERRGIGSQKIRTVNPRVQTQPSSNFSVSLCLSVSVSVSLSFYIYIYIYPSISGNIKKRSRLYFYTSALSSFSAIQHNFMAELL